MMATVAPHLMATTAVGITVIERGIETEIETERGTEGASIKEGNTHDFIVCTSMCLIILF